MEKVYFSKILDLEDWSSNDCSYMTLFFIPNRWWSIKDWKFALSMRARMLETFSKLK